MCDSRRGRKDIGKNSTVRKTIELEKQNKVRDSAEIRSGKMRKN